MAAQLFDAARAQIPELSHFIRQGKFQPLLDWLRTSVHSRGSRDRIDDILQDVTGNPLNAQAYKHHLARRYLKEETA